MAAEGHGLLFRSFWSNFSCLKNLLIITNPATRGLTIFPGARMNDSENSIDHRSIFSKPRRYSTVEAFEVALLLQSHQFGLTTLPEMAEF